MKEFFESRRLTGNINVVCKFDDGTQRVWQTKKETVIENILQIVKEYSEANYLLTLRQLHYQLVSRNWIINHDTAYKKLGSILDDCRYAGLIDWNGIEDRGRVPHMDYSVNSVEEALEDTVDQYKRDRQEGQTKIVELWTEKDALSGILKRTTRKYHIRLVVNKGYTSSSALYTAYRRIVKAISEGKKFTVLYFGDHDPSGLDMVRDIKDRLTFMLTRGSFMKSYGKVNEWWDDMGYSLYDVADMYGDYSITKLVDQESISSTEEDKLIDLFSELKNRWFLDSHELFEVKHIGLTMEQIKKYSLPKNPTKLTDTRSSSYVSKFGNSSWEVDALSPQILTDLVEKHVLDSIDVDIYNDMLVKEMSDVKALRNIIDNIK